MSQPVLSGKDPRVPKVLWISLGLLLASATWASWQGALLGSRSTEARDGTARLARIHAALEDPAFRAALAEAVQTYGQGQGPFRTLLTGIAQKTGARLDGSPTESVSPVPGSTEKEIVVSLALKELSMTGFLDYARTVELEIPDAVVQSVTLRPVPSAGDRWVASLKVAKRVPAVSP